MAGATPRRRESGATGLAARLERLRAGLGLTRRELSEIIPVSEQTILRWERGVRPLSIYDWRLRELGELVDAAEREVRKERLAWWFRQPQAGLGGRSPLEELAAYRGTERVRQLLHGLEWGLPE